MFTNKIVFDRFLSFLPSIVTYYIASKKLQNIKLNNEEMCENFNNVTLIQFICAICGCLTGQSVHIYNSDGFIVVTLICLIITTIIVYVLSMNKLKDHYLSYQISKYYLIISFLGIVFAILCEVFFIMYLNTDLKLFIACVCTSFSDFFCMSYCGSLIKEKM